jgi:hypothetical protein
MSDILYKGKFAHELTHEEAIDCALHFRDAAVNAVQWHAKAERRMNKMAEALTSRQIRQLDKWLDDHERDALKGDGTDLWPRWQDYRID